MTPSNVGNNPLKSIIKENPKHWMTRIVSCDHSIRTYRQQYICPPPETMNRQFQTLWRQQKTEPFLSPELWIMLSDWGLQPPQPCREIYACFRHRRFREQKRLPQSASLGAHTLELPCGTFPCQENQLPEGCMGHCSLHLKGMLVWDSFFFQADSTIILLLI